MDVRRTTALLVTIMLAAIGIAPGPHAARASSEAPGAGVGRLGVELRPIGGAGGAHLITGTQTAWVRRNAILWSDIEPVEGQRLWNAPSQQAIEAELAFATQQGWSVIVIVRRAPVWARATPASPCGPIRADKLAAFAAFMADLVARLSPAPFNVEHWELWNEPDVEPEAAPVDDEVGCWGESADPGFGGWRYAAMLQAVYPAVKAADPDAKVLVGGLAMSCHPDIAATVACPSGRFLEGVLEAGGGAYFDGVSYHAYDYVQGYGIYSNANWGSTSSGHASVAHAKAGFLRDLLTRFGASGKELYLTEIGLVCYQCGDSGGIDYEMTKGFYVVHAFSAALAEGHIAALWYNLRDNQTGPGAFGTGLVDFYFGKRPAYYTYGFAVAELAGAEFRRRVDDYPNVHVYEFLRGDRVLWVVWSADGQIRTITLPSLPIEVRMAEGGRVPASRALTVLSMPHFVSLNRPAYRQLLPIVRADH